MRWNRSCFKPSCVPSDVVSSSPSKPSCRRSRYSRTVRNVDARSVETCTGPKPFWLAHPKDPESIKFGSKSCGRDYLERPK